MKHKYFIKLWDNEKIEIHKATFEKLEHGLFIDVCNISKRANISIPLQNIKLWYVINLEEIEGE